MIRVGDYVKFDHPNGSIGKVETIRRDGPFEFRPCYYVQWVYGRDVHGEPMTSVSALDEEELVRASQEEYDAIANRKGWGE